jgi:Spy/CpxP family protein refolding chaperone
MTRKIIALIAAGAFALGGFTYLQAKDADEHGPGHGHKKHGPGGHHMGNPLEKVTEDLDLTAEQKAKVQPILDQTKPQIEAIHQEAMEKMKTLLESTGAQIRPLLTPQQQQKFDAMKKAHEDMHKAKKAMHDAKKM